MNTRTNTNTSAAATAASSPEPIEAVTSLPARKTLTVRKRAAPRSKAPGSVGMSSSQATWVPMPASTPKATAPTIKLTGFGASAAFGAHVFKLQLPPGRAGEVVLTEDFGYLAGLNGTPEHETRACFPRQHWTLLGDTARKDFNARLRERKAPAGSWNIGETLIDRMLGKELCILLWAAEHAHPEQLSAICLKWTTLRPEERWWLYAMTAAQGGQAQDGERGWRKALFHALSDIGMSGQRQLMDSPQTFSLFDSPR